MPPTFPEGLHLAVPRARLHSYAHATSLSSFPQQHPHQNYQHLPQTAPRVEEVPQEAAAPHSSRNSSGPYHVEEPGVWGC